MIPGNYKVVQFIDVDGIQYDSLRLCSSSELGESCRKLLPLGIEPCFNLCSGDHVKILNKFENVTSYYDIYVNKIISIKMLSLILLLASIQYC